MAAGFEPLRSLQRHHSLDLAIPRPVQYVHLVRVTDGRLTGRAGDSYVLMVGWEPDGTLRSQSLHPFGSATLDETSPHYADQAPRFARRQLKDLVLDQAALRASATRTDRPGGP